MDYKDKVRNLRTANHLSISLAAGDVWKQKAKESKLSRLSNPDTVRRLEIQRFIRESYLENKSRRQTLEDVRKQFSGEEYEKYHIYFESWVNNVYKVKKISSTTSKGKEDKNGMER